MYTPPAYAENNLTVLHACMRAWSFATLVTHGARGLNATHLPFLLEAEGARLIRAQPGMGEALA